MLEDKICPAIEKEKGEGCLFPYEICHRQGTKYTCKRYRDYQKEQHRKVQKGYVEKGGGI